MTGPGDIGYGPALDAINERLDRLEAVLIKVAGALSAERDLAIDYDGILKLAGLEESSRENENSR